MTRERRAAYELLWRCHRDPDRGDKTNSGVTRAELAAELGVGSNAAKHRIENLRDSGAVTMRPGVTDGGVVEVYAPTALVEPSEYPDQGAAPR